MPSTTSFSVIAPVAKAAVAALSVSSFLALSPIYEDVPDDAPFPYTALGDFIETPNDTAGKHGRIVTFALHIFTQGSTTQGRGQQAQQILNAAIARLDYAPLAVTGYTFLCCQYETAVTQAEDVSGEIVTHMIATFRVWVSES